MGRLLAIKPDGTIGRRLSKHLTCCIAILESGGTVTFMPSKSVIAAACDACIRSVIIDRAAPREPRDHRVRFDPELQAKVTRLTRTYDGLNAVTAQLDESFKFHISRVKGKDDPESHLA